MKILQPIRLEIVPTAVTESDGIVSSTDGLLHTTSKVSGSIEPSVPGTI
jgi:hypothetical protein